MTGEDTVRALRDALAISPENTPLRVHLASTLAALSRYAEAEQEYRTALAAAPHHLACKYGLAQAYHQQGKSSHALVLLEDLAKNADAPAGSLVLYSRLLLAAGDITRAASMYRRALEIDPSLSDEELSTRLGVVTAPEPYPEPESGPEEPLRATWQAPAEAPDVEIEKPDVGFQAVGGMEAVKEQIRLKIIYPLENPQLYAAYGKKVGGGILLYGPPGCGKTHLARATAGEIRSTFLAIGISDVLDMWIGASEKNLHALFEQAREHAPCVMFFDEVDALGGSRADLKHSGARHLVNQFLSELDGIQSSNDGLLILAATNAPWQLDAAFRRPGRFDRIVFVPPPDETSRTEILRILCENRPTDHPDFRMLARKTEGYSGADLKAIVDVAVESKLQEAMRQGALRPITTKDLLAAVKTVKPSTKDWFATARNYALYSNQSGLYDDILKYLKIS